MSRADWGGGGDLSGLFGSLVNEYQNRVEAATKREIADAEAEQKVNDAEKYDQWKNGLITDEAWLAYIQERVTTTASDVDKTDHENWVTMLREHTQAISDSQTEQGFSEGTVSIHRIIDVEAAEAARRLKAKATVPLPHFYGSSSPVNSGRR